jgi:hypothetical protein
MFENTSLGHEGSQQRSKKTWLMQSEESQFDGNFESYCNDGFSSLGSTIGCLISLDVRKRGIEQLSMDLFNAKVK